MTKTRKISLVAATLVVAPAVSLFAAGSLGSGSPMAPSQLRSVVSTANMASTPAAQFDPDAFLRILTQMSPQLATQAINALSPADRSELALDVQAHVDNRPSYYGG